jgi:5-methylcytosine-specific restriction enzyme subunit McrC
MNRKVIELAEYQTKSPIEDESSDENTHHVYDDSLAKIQLHPNDKKLILFLKKQGILSIRELKSGLEISSFSYIGVAQFTDFTVKILPKFSMTSTNLPKLIAYAFELDDIIIPENEVRFTPDENYLVDILITFFIRKCQKLLKQGLFKSYVTYQNDITSLRGKLLLKQQIINSAQYKPVFSCEYDELEYNNLENQILLRCLRISYKLTQSDVLKKEIRRLTGQFLGFVDDKQITYDDFQKIHYTRLNQHYEQIHELCKLIIFPIGISDFYKETRYTVSSFFVDMSKVFEKFVTRLFREYYSPWYLVESQKNRNAWLNDDGTSSYIRTDILLTDQQDRRKIIIDTKYKRKLSSYDPYQIGFYIHEYNEKIGYALLPKYSDSREQTMTSMVQEIIIEVKTIDIDKTLDLIYSRDSTSEVQLMQYLEKLVPAQ